MVSPFDIFKRQPGGSVRWLEVVADLEAAKLRVKELVEYVPGEYFIFSLASGRRFDVIRGRGLQYPDEEVTARESTCDFELSSLYSGPSCVNR